MSFSGIYQKVSEENFVPFMKAIGLCEELIEQVKDPKSTYEIEQNDVEFKITVTFGPKVMVNRFTVGKETELDTISGERIQTVVYLEGNKLKFSFKGLDSVTELVDPDTLKSTMTLGSIVYKTTSKRM